MLSKKENSLKSHNFVDIFFFTIYNNNDKVSIANLYSGYNSVLGGLF